MEETVLKFMNKLLVLPFLLLTGCANEYYGHYRPVPPPRYYPQYHPQYYYYHHNHHRHHHHDHD